MQNNNSILSIRNVKKNFRIKNNTVEVLGGINIEVKRGEFISIVGESGCGKSTLLKMITALEDVTEGEIAIDGEIVKAPTEKCSVIFQEPRLFPWLSVEKNIAFTLPKTMPAEEKRRIVSEHIELVKLNGFEKALPSRAPRNCTKPLPSAISAAAPRSYGNFR